jgi:hypothetical protein
MINPFNANQVMKASVNMELGRQPHASHSLVTKVIIKLANTIFSTFSKSYQASRADLLARTRQQKPTAGETSTTPKPIQTSSPIGLHTSKNAGFPIELLNKKDKGLLLHIASEWRTQAPTREEWTAEQIAKQINQKESFVQELLDSVCLKANASARFPAQSINKLFKAIEEKLSGSFQASMQPGVRALWNDRLPSANALFGKASEKESWTIQELGRFLAVSEEALVTFLGGDEKTTHSYAAIRAKLANAENRTVNELLETNRTQVDSLRWSLI